MGLRQSVLAILSRIREKPVAATAVFCAVVQLMSATWFVRSFDTPSYATLIARNLVRTGRYEGGSQRIWGPEDQDSGRTFRQFHLPGGPLYLAGLFRLLPEPLHRYVHVPVTVLLVTAVANVGWWMGGWQLGLATGLFASVQPFVVLHGPVWEDTFLSAALTWAAIAPLTWRLGNSSQGLRARPASGWLLLLLCGAAGWASMTRLESQIILLLVAAATIVSPGIRSLRAEGAALALGVVVAVAGWGLRNRLVTGEFTIGTSHDGITLWWCNNPLTKQALRSGGVEALSFTPDHMSLHWARTAGMSESQANRYYVQQALQYVRTQPVDALTTSLFRLSLSLTGVRPGESLASLRNLVGTTSCMTVLILGVWGLILLRRQLDPGIASIGFCFFAIIAVVVLGLLSIGPNGLRYRITAEGILWVGSAATVLHLARARAGAIL